MLSKNLRKVLFLCLICFFSLSLTHCTSSDDDVSALEEEMENIDVEANEESLSDELADLDEISEDELIDEIDSEDNFEADTDEEVADFDEDEDQELDEEFAENDEFSEDEDELADLDEDDPDFDDFDEFDQDNANDKEFAQNEQSLEQELNQKPQDYPMAQNAQPAFPEEVLGQEQGGAPMVPPPPPLANDGTITSETQDIALAEPNIPELPQDDLGDADPIMPIDDEEEVNVPTWVPVVKIKTDPFFRNQRLMNAVYIARPRDSIESISQKIYGEDRSQELKADNPHLEKGVDPGDKVYYNSPNRPSDKGLLKFYYADIGLEPQAYQSREGDNMRRLGSKLLGFPDGWKEVWAINPNIDSKTILPAGLDIRYWTGEESSTNMQLAQTETQPIESETEEMPVTSGSIEEFNEPSLPPEPPLPEAEIAMPENNMEPEIVPDIEPFPEQGVETTPTPAVVSANDADSLLSVGAMALLLIAGVGLVAIQIKKRKDMTGVTPQSLEYTQV